MTPFAYSQTKTMGQTVSLDPAFDDLIDKNAKIEVLAEGFKWSEGPAWVKQGSYLIFSDVPKNTIFKWKEGENLTEFLKPSGYTGRGDYSDEPGSNGSFGQYSPLLEFLLPRRGRAVALLWVFVQSETEHNSTRVKYTT